MIYQIPERLDKVLSETYARHSPKEIANAIKKMSDFYIEHPDQRTPWEENWCYLAQLFYYLPLNTLRAQAALNRIAAKEYLFGKKNISRWVDCGAGLGPFFWALEAHLQSPLASWTSEPARSAIKFHHIESANVAADFILKHFPMSQRIGSGHDRGSLSSSFKSLSLTESDLLSFSYALTEEVNLTPVSDQQYTSLIIEPSTHQDGRRLMSYRDQNIAAGNFIQAPCTHQQLCPLLALSKKDWCHDRLLWSRPEWFLEIEKRLPMENKSLTYSYLCITKRPPPMTTATDAASDFVTYRMVGDALNERGKTRQLACGPNHEASSQDGTGDATIVADRKYLSWLHRHGKPQEVPRGDRIQVARTLPRVSEEIRIAEPLDHSI